MQLFSIILIKTYVLKKRLIIILTIILIINTTKTLTFKLKRLNTYQGHNSRFTYTKLCIYWST